MSRSRWVRIEAGRQENVAAAMAAASIAAGVGIVTFYFTRMLLAREPLVDHDQRSGSTDVVTRDPEG